MIQTSDESQDVFERFNATLGRTIERTVAKAERVLAGPEIDPAALVQVVGQLILTHRAALGVIAPLGLWREFFPSDA